MKAKRIFVVAKCSDLFTGQLYDANDKIIFEASGYVPQFFPDQHWGDYVMLDIELATGKILNWTKPTEAQIKTWMEEK